jgi:hypothetical protein
MPNTSPPFILKLTQYLPKLEAFFLAGALIGVMLKYAGIDNTVFNVSLVGLAATFFLSAYRPVEIPFDESDKPGFTHLLVLIIAPKIAWISAAVVTLGIFFFFTGGKGYKQLLFIGGTSIAPVTLIFLYGIVSGVRHVSFVTPVLYRIVPLLLLAVYLYFK